MITTTSVDEVDLIEEIFSPHPRQISAKDADRVFSVIEPSSPSVPKVIPAVKALIDSELPEKGAPMLRSPETDHAFLAVPADKDATQATDVSDRDRSVFASANGAEGGASHHCTHGPSVLLYPVHYCPGPRGAIEAQRGVQEPLSGTTTSWTTTPTAHGPSY